MASPSSSRFQREHDERKSTKSFQTCIYPHQREIQLCPKFKRAWINHLRKHSLGSIQHQDGRSIQIALYIDGNDCYMTDGRFVSFKFGFKEPTKIILTYGVSQNYFRMTIIKNESTEVLSIDGSDEECMIIPKPQSYCQTFETIVDEDEDHGLTTFNDDPRFRWRLTITEAYANTAKNQVLHVPQETVRHVLKNRKSIEIRTLHNLDGIRCTIVTYKRKPGKLEMYLSKGWFEFMRANKLKEGDVVEFQLSDPPEVIAVDIVRKTS